ncbi:carbohydrate-binding protein [Paractinoplanes durhamensis]
MREPATGLEPAARPATEILPSWPSGPLREQPSSPPSVAPSSFLPVTGQAAVPAARSSSPRRTSPAPPPAPPPPNATAYRIVQAEDFDEQNGIKVEADESGPGSHIGFITTGDWVRYDSVGFTDVPANTLLISASNWAANNGTGEVEVHLDNRSGAPIGRMTIPNNADWFTFTTYSMKIRPTTGVHTVYLTFSSRQTEEFGNIDWFRFQH